MQSITKILGKALEDFKTSNTYKYETPLESPQAGVVKVKGKKVNYTPLWKWLLEQ